MGTNLEDRTLTLSPEEAAERLGVARSTVDNWRWTGSGPRYVKVGGRVRYRLSDLADYLDRQTRRSTSDARPHATPTGARTIKIPARQWIRGHRPRPVHLPCAEDPEPRAWHPHNHHTRPDRPERLHQHH
ncbi:MAG: helix-turn-helix domain-containing protein [Gemmatimonadota bacterium]